MIQDNLGLAYLSAGIVLSAIGAILLRMNNGIGWDMMSLSAVICMNVAMILWGSSLRTLELSYAAFIWYAADAIIVVIAGTYLFKEEMNTLKLLSICVVIAGIIGLNFSTPSKGKREVVNSTQDTKLK